MKHLFKCGALFNVGDGKNCKFWENCWAQQVPLKIAYENVYSMVRYPSCNVADC